MLSLRAMLWHWLMAIMASKQSHRGSDSAKHNNETMAQLSHSRVRDIMRTRSISNQIKSESERRAVGVAVMEIKWISDEYEAALWG